MKVSQIAIEQWKQLCKRHRNTHDNIVRTKIERAYLLGQVKHIYKNGDVIVRYHDLNLLSTGEELQVIWRDTTAPKVDVSDELKQLYEESILFW